MKRKTPENYHVRNRKAWEYAAYVLISCVCLCLGTGIRAKASEEVFPRFKDGDVVGFIGDSITHVVYRPLGYVEMVEQYYLSRFPEEEIEFRNLGSEGYRATNTLDIYDLDPAFRGLNKAVVMLGTNEAILKYSTEEYIADMEALIGKLKAEGLDGRDILLLSPPVCDQYCTMNYDAYGNMRWTYEDRLLEYLEALEAKAAEWGVGYLNLHAPMAALTEEMQKEDNRNTLTTDCIHPNTTGHRVLACYILQAQGLTDEPLSEIAVSKQGKVQSLRDTLTDIYYGEKGISGILHSETLPVPAAGDITDFRTLFGDGSLLYEKPFRIEGLKEAVSYRMLFCETELGIFTGKELAEGIDLGSLETHPQRAAMEQIDALSRKRHQNTVTYRGMWVDLMMHRASFTQEQIAARYESWRGTDQDLQAQMRQLVRDMADDTYAFAVLEEDCSVEDLEQEKAAAIEQARQAREQARQEAVQQACSIAREQTGRAAERLRTLLEQIFSR